MIHIERGWHWAFLAAAALTVISIGWLIAAIVIGDALHAVTFGLCAAAFASNARWAQLNDREQREGR